MQALQGKSCRAGEAMTITSLPARRISVPLVEGAQSLHAGNDKTLCEPDDRRLAGSASAGNTMVWLTRSELGRERNGDTA
jgi:hypothetical protein